MDEIRYIHAGDLHLDASFEGIGRDVARGGHLVNLLNDATFRALENLVRLCQEEKPDFVVLAGDIYNQEDRSIRAQLELRTVCQRLGEMGITVFIAHGNHDPLSSRFNQISWPDNVHIFGPTVETCPVMKNGELLALTHGISHPDARVADNLARQFKRDDSKKCFQLGVLHCTVNTASGDRYAPCSLEDLRVAGLDAWALGHVHGAKVLCEDPLIAYSGCMQGLHIKEDGPRGCYMVTVRAEGEGWRATPDFRALGPVRWQTAVFDISDVDTMDALERKITDYLEDYRASCENSVEAAIFRIRLEGHTHLDSSLREGDLTADTFPALAQVTYEQPSIWIKDFEIATAPAKKIEDLLERDDIMGETARVVKNLLDNPEEIEQCSREALAPIFYHSSLKKILPWPDASQIRELLIQAENICQDMLEKR